MNFSIDLQQYNPYDALLVKNYNKKSLFLSFQDFQDFSVTGAGIPGQKGHNSIKKKDFIVKMV